VTLALERPIDRLVRGPQFNPLYHTGTITVFLLILVAATGVYLTMFFQFGFAASYEAVGRIEASLIGRVMRAVHRYASDLALLAAVLHGYRTFFMDRFRGPRWLAWVTGVIATICLWIIGATGYWLPVDERAQLLTQSLIRLIGGWAPGGRFLLDNLLSDAAGAGWAPIMLVLIVHVGLSLAVGGFFVLHVRRLSRPKLAPPRFWLAPIAAIVVLAAILAPVGMLPAASPLRLAGPVDLDLFYLAYLPVALTPNVPALPFWIGAMLLVILFTALPCLLRRKPLPPVHIHAERCTGCTLCAADCPYKALVMAPREDESGHKLIAAINEKLCVSCGMCLGSCSFDALSLGDQSPARFSEEAAARIAEGHRQAGGRPVKVVFACERHVRASRPLRFSETSKVSSEVIIPVTCIAAAHPDLMTQAVAAGASEVQFIGCPPEDCANREGNAIMQARLDRKRPPRATHGLASTTITSDWLSPADFRRALAAPGRQPVATAYDLVISRANWRRLIPAAIVLAAAMAAAVALSRAPFRAYAEEQARVEIFFQHQVGAALAGYEAAAVESRPAGPIASADSARLALVGDGDAKLDKTYAVARGRAIEAFEQVALVAGRQRLRLELYEGDAIQPQVLLDQAVELAPRQVLPLRFTDAHLAGDPRAGARLFAETRGGTGAGCRICHSLQAGVRLVGPSLAGVGTAAATRVPGLSAEAYIRQSLVAPDAYLVAGYRAGQMPPDYLKRLSAAQIEDLVAYLLTLR
jgi:ferredoxin/coenzyme F420-reducing hydrogenase delta subunit/mono/diheme cytochrome c family protein